MASETEIEEERRLFYVAMTRAKKAVSFAFTQTRMRNGKHESNSPSRCLREIDSQYIANPITNETDSEQGESRWSSFGSRQATSTPRQRPVSSSSRPGSASSRPTPPSKPSPLSARPAVPQPVRRPQPVQARVPDADFEPTPIVQLKAGQRIEHNRFGFGKILEITGPVTDLKAKISFDDHGDKILILKYAKIRVISQ